MQTPQDILNASRLVFPGVGEFAADMEVLRKTGYFFFSLQIFFFDDVVVEVVVLCLWYDISIGLK